MKITELDALERSPAPILHGVEVDGECFTPPAGLETIGLLWQGDALDMISDDLVDTIIAFGLSGVEVILEIRPADEVDHGYLLTLAGNAGFSVAAVPASDETELEAWGDHCAAFCEALLTTPNFGKTLFPATGFVSYLIAEAFASADAMTPRDAYTLERFVEPTPEAWSDACKARMRAALEGVLGGRNGLEAFLASLVGGLYAETEKFVIEASSEPRDA